MKKILPGLLWLLYGVGLGIIHYPGGLGWWFVGFFLAGVLIWGDRLLYVWWLKPYEQLSIQFQYWWKQRAFRAAFRLLVERRDEQTKLVLKSAGFALLWFPITIYVLTSTGSVTAAGIVMALGFRLVLSILGDWKQPTMLSKWFCWQIKREVLVQELRVITGLFIGIWAMVVGLLLFT